MRIFLKWAIPILVIGAVIWFVFSMGFKLPIDEQVRIETPAGPIEFRFVVLPSGPVRISTAPWHDFHDIHVPGREIGTVFSRWRRDDRLDFTFPSGAELTLHRTDAGVSTGFWTAPANARVAPYQPATSSSSRGKHRTDRSSTAESNGSDPDIVTRHVGRWRLRAEDSTIAILELHALRDGSGIFGTVSALTGNIEFGGHVNEDGLRLTFFNGERAVVARGRLRDDGTLAGEWWDSDRGLVAWTASREE